MGLIYPSIEKTFLYILNPVWFKYETKKGTSGPKWVNVVDFTIFFPKARLGLKLKPWMEQPFADRIGTLWNEKWLKNFCFGPIGYCG